MVAMASHDAESGFEALLKPLQDISSKMWDIMLTKALEKYLEQINNGATSFVNFMEAAVLVQNSASFYCKRVDSVHLGCLQFVEKLTNTDKEDGEEAQASKKRRVVAKNYISDTFEPLELFFSESCIDVNLETIDKHSEKKSIILNKYIKGTKKPNTSCPVYQSKGSVMGLKEEFRLHWAISSTGILNEDFVTNGISKLLDWCVLPSDGIIDNVDEEVVRSSEDQVDNEMRMDVDNGPPEPFPSQLEVPASPHPAPSPVAPSPPSSPCNIPVAKPIKDAYEEFSLTLPSITGLLQKQTFLLPKALIEEVKDWKKKKLENKANADNPNYVFNSYLNFQKHLTLLNKPSSVEEKLYLSAKERRKEILQRQKQYTKAIEKAAQEFHDVFPGFVDMDEGVADDFDDIAIDDMEGIVVVNIPEMDKEVGGYTQDKREMMTAYMENKRRCAAELSEVARRVQAWHESLATSLDEAEARSQFDVHQYGTRILETFQEPPENRPIVSFQAVVKDQPKPEISRFFLSTLMLANTYNVEIMLTKKGDLVKDCLELKLLSTVRHHEEMDENLTNTHN